jgi:hypothetical protein
MTTARFGVASRVASAITLQRLLFGLAMMLLGIIRSIIGVVMIVSPARLAATLGVDPVAAERTGWLSQMVGAREIGIGLGGLKAVRQGENVGLWCSAAALADSADVLAVASALRGRKVRRGPALLFIAFAAAGVLADVTVWRHMRDRAPGDRPSGAYGDT